MQWALPPLVKVITAERYVANTDTKLSRAKTRLSKWLGVRWQKYKVSLEYVFLKCPIDLRSMGHLSHGGRLYGTFVPYRSIVWDILSQQVEIYGTFRIFMGHLSPNIAVGTWLQISVTGWLEVWLKYWVSDQTTELILMPLCIRTTYWSGTWLGVFFFIKCRNMTTQHSQVHILSFTPYLQIYTSRFNALQHIVSLTNWIRARLLFL